MVLCRSLCLFIGGSNFLSVCLSKYDQVDGQLPKLSNQSWSGSVFVSVWLCDCVSVWLHDFLFLCLCGCVSVCLLVCLCKYDRVGVVGGQPKFSN